MNRALLVLLSMLAMGCGLIDPELGEVKPLDAIDNPCFAADVLGGLSEQDPSELKALYDCLNTRGAFDGAAGVVDALVTSEHRDARISGLEFVSVLNRLLRRADFATSLQQAADLIRGQDLFLLHLIRTLAEWTYGLPWPHVRDQFALGGGALASPTAVEQGLVQPLIPVLGTAAGALLDGGDLEPIAAAFKELSQQAELVEVLDTLAHLADEQESELFSHAAEDLGAYLAASPDDEGRDTLLALLDAILTPQLSLGDRAPMVAALPAVDSILGDAVATFRAVNVLGGLYEDGDLQVLPGQVHSLLSMDAHGNTVFAAEGSAFTALFQLMEAADAPVRCPLFAKDSMALYILETISSWNASTLEAVVPLADALAPTFLPLTSVLCSEPVRPEVLEHLPALTRLAESGALHSLVPLLEALYDNGGSHNKLREVLDLVLAMQLGGAIDELGEHALQELEQPFMGNVLELIGAFVAPTDPETQGDIYSLLRLLAFLVEPPSGQGHERSPIGLLAGPLHHVVVLEEERLAVWLQRWAVLLVDQSSESNSFYDYFAPLLAVDPELNFVAAVGELLGDSTTLRSVVLVLDTGEVVAAVAAAVAPDGGEGPLGLVGRISADGTLEDLLTLLAWLVDLMDQLGLTATPAEQ